MAASDTVELPPGAKKLDDGKPALCEGVLWRFPRALAAVAEVSRIGTTKYGLPPDDTNFYRVPNGRRRYTNATVRHILAESTEGNEHVEYGGLLPPEGMKTTHDAQVAWNALARLEIRLRLEEENKNADPGDPDS